MSVDLIELFSHIDAADAAGRTTRHGLVADDGGEFADEFTATAIAFIADGDRLPLTLTAVPEVSENLLALPVDATIDANHNLEGPADAERRPVEVKKVKGDLPAAMTITIGRLSEDDGGKQFVALGMPGTKEFRVEIQGTYTSDSGVLHTVSYAGGGGILPDGLHDKDFVAEPDGAVLRVQGPPGGLAVQEAEFGSLNRISVERGDDDTTRVAVEGSVLIGRERRNVRATFDHRPQRSVFRLVDLDSSERLLVGSAPTERVHVQMLGGLDGAPRTEGEIVLYDLETWEEIRRLPVDGRISGLTWDGKHLLQAKWPSGDILLLNPAAEGGEAEVLSSPAGRNVSGIAADGHQVFMGVCAMNIMSGEGSTLLALYDRERETEVERLPREHAMSAGIAVRKNELVGVVNGADQTPVSSASSILIMDKKTGAVSESVVFPRNFFIEDIAQLDETTAYVTVTEGLSGFASRGSVYSVTLGQSGPSQA